MADETTRECACEDCRTVTWCSWEPLYSGDGVVGRWWLCDACAVRRAQERAQPADEPRAIIRHFAAAMERKLAANDGVKGGWRWNPQVRLRQKLQEEVGELSDALEAYLWRDGSEEDVLLKAADVANVAMMLADVVGALPPTDERGR